MIVAVHGGGYVGLTAAIHFAMANARVIVYDPDLDTITRIRAGKPRAGEFLSYINADVADLVSKQRLDATNDFKKIIGADIHVIAVPTEREGEPYGDIVEKLIVDLAKVTRPESIILVESTLAPGTIDRILDDVKKALHPQKQLGENWFLAVCPRRDWFADRDKNLANLPRVVGGVTGECTFRASNALGMVSGTIMETDYRTAELCKALENALLHVPLMFAYQMATAYPDHNVAEALALAGTHWRLPLLHLGFGTGGRCVPLGTKYLVENSNVGLTPNGRLAIGEAAIDWDDDFRFLIAEIVHRNTKGRSRRALVLGIGYRPEFKDAGLSPGLDVARHLKDFGISAGVCDPLWSKEELRTLAKLEVRPPSLMENAILLATPHKAFLELPLKENMWRPGMLVIDGTGAWRGFKELFKQRGIDYRIVGEPGWSK